METIAAILFGIGVAGSTALAILTVCLIGTRHKQKRLITLDKQRQITQDFWNKYWATAYSPPCTASRNELTSGNEYARAKPDKLDVTEEFGQLERVTQEADK